MTSTASPLVPAAAAVAEPAAVPQTRPAVQPIERTRSNPAQKPARVESTKPPEPPQNESKQKSEPVAIVREISRPPDSFIRSRFHFAAGIGPTETAQITDDEGRVLFTYRGFASVLGIVAGLIAAIVLIAGIAAAFFLLLERNGATAVGALVLSLFFALIVVMLIPPTNVTLLTAGASVLKIVQVSRSSAPAARGAIVSPEGRRLATLQKSILSRAGTNRWIINDERGRRIGYAADESLRRAYLRKIAGKFDRDYEANVHIVIGKNRIATIHRRPDTDGFTDVLEMLGDGIDPRVVVAIATLILGSEP